MSLSAPSLIRNHNRFREIPSSPIDEDNDFEEQSESWSEIALVVTNRNETTELVDNGSSSGEGTQQQGNQNNNDDGNSLSASVEREVDEDDEEMGEDGDMSHRRVLAACLVPLSLFVLMTTLIASESDSGDEKEDQGDNLFSVLLFMSFMNILCALFDRSSSRSATPVPLSDVETPDVSGSFAEEAAAMHYMSFQAQLTAAILESRRVQLLELLGRSDEINPRQSQGVTEDKRAHWHRFSFAASSTSIDSSDEKIADVPTCSICLSEYENRETVLRLPCGHEYHEECVLSWVSEHTRCPLCNYDLQQEDEEDDTSNVSTIRVNPL